MLVEVWKDIIGYEGLYQVSNLGRVKSLGKGGTHKTIRLLSQKITKYGYKTLVLFKDGRRQDCRVHRLVATAFVPNPQQYVVVNHKDGDKSNNCADNLEWCTTEYNVVHAHQLGLCHPPKGKKHWNCKLSDEDVLNIKREYVKYSTTCGSVALGKKYGVSSRTVRDIIEGRRRSGVVL